MALIEMDFASGGGMSSGVGYYTVEGTATDSSHASSSTTAANAFAFTGVWTPNGSNAAGDWIKLTWTSAKKVRAVSFAPSYSTYATSPASIVWKIEGSTDGVNFDTVLADNIEMGRNLGFIPYANAIFEPKNLLAVRIICKSVTSGASSFSISQARIFYDI